MSKCEIRELLLRLLPYVNGRKQPTALFAVVLLLGMTHVEFDAPHLHIEPAIIQPTTVVTIAATSTASGVMTYDSLAQTTADVPMGFLEMGYRWDTKSL
jgi:hypothetical protein